MSEQQRADATVTDPVIPGFHPDPSVCRVDNDYYGVCPGFEHFFGIPVFHSRGPVHWTQIGNSLDRPSQLRLIAETPSSDGIHAPHRAITTTASG